MTEMYRIGVFETCLLTGEKRIRQINSLHPVNILPNHSGLSFRDVRPLPNTKFSEPNP
jgi:hypothetical protein